MYIFSLRTRVLLTGLLVLGLIAPLYAESQKTDKDALCRADIKALIRSYEKALNASDVDGVIRLYAEDGIFMPSTKPTAAGIEQVMQAYRHVFRALDLNVAFHIKEIVLRGEIAFVRTVSDGKISLLKENKTILNDSRELFVVKRINGDWKIYRYIFNEASQPKTI